MTREITDLAPEERRLVDDLLAAEDAEPGVSRVLEMVPLALGVTIFVAAAMITVRHLNDHTARWVMLPGAGAAVVLVATHLYLYYYRRRRKLYASIIRKLMWAGWRRGDPHHRTGGADT